MGRPGQAAAKQFERTITTAERDAAIARYWIGRDINQVMAHFGLAKSTVCVARQRAIEAAIVPAGQEAIAAELLKIDIAEHAILEVMRANHIVIQDGHVVRLDDEPITDHKPVLDAIGKWVPLMARRARLQGLDAPDRTEVTVITRDTTEQAIAKLEAELAEDDAVARGQRATRAPAVPARTTDRS